MDIKIKVKKDDYDDVDVKLVIDGNEYNPHIPEIGSCFHSCGIAEINDVAYCFNSNKKKFQQLTSLQNLQLTLLCAVKAINEPIIQGSIVTRIKNAKKINEIGKLLYTLEGIQISAERKNPNSGNTIVAFQFDKLNFIKKNKLW